MALFEKPIRILVLVVTLSLLVLLVLNRGEVVLAGTTLVQTIAAKLDPTPIEKRVGSVAKRPLEPVGFSPDRERSGRGPGE